ncbi:hypothetical protein HK105_200013 [Polyrhizophydium stewartii]|uniref:Uncharacterized protein n=1 Tax=Polyrhizophydium stewartii TaxID=2732419 RepID=A0ABR4NK96_9FUNG|nr:hypothetical protein HK105_006681 [Polyrhizophydium stewartii]
MPPLAPRLAPQRAAAPCVAAVPTVRLLHAAAFARSAQQPVGGPQRGRERDVGDPNVHPTQAELGRQLSSNRSRLAIAAFSIGVGAVTLLVAYSMVHSEAAGPRGGVGAPGSDNEGPLAALIEASREFPGLFVWGSNRAGLVAGRAGAGTGTAAASDEPTSIEALRGRALRDLALADTHAAAVSDRGDLLLWGKRLGVATPTVAARELSLTKVACAADKIYALSKSGTLYEWDADPSVVAPSPKNAKPVVIKMPATAAWDEKITQIACGANHLVVLSSRGKVYTLACNSNGNHHGQLGLGHAEPVQQAVLHPVAGLASSVCDKLAVGREHTVVGTNSGGVYAFGLNRFGQLAIGNTPDLEQTSPTPVSTLWSSAGLTSGKLRDKQPSGTKCTQIAAGGDTTLFVVETDNSTHVLASGNGQFGQLGNGAYSHAVATPVAVKGLSNLVEYDPVQRRVAPIRVAKVAAGDLHCAVVLSNSISDHPSDTRSRSWLGWISSGFGAFGGHSTASTKPFGRDVLVWGMNMDGQLRRADGKRGNLPVPGYVLPIPYEPHKSSKTIVGELEAASTPTVPPSTPSTADADTKDLPKGPLANNVRLQLASTAAVRLSDRRRVIAEQDIALGSSLTAVFTRCE